MMSDSRWDTWLEVRGVLQIGNGMPGLARLNRGRGKGSRAMVPGSSVVEG
jgi:hypothetical protein